MEAVKNLAAMRSVTEITELHRSPEHDIGDPNHPLNLARDEILERPDVQGSYFANSFSSIIDRAADTEMSREELVALEREWIDVRATLQAYEYGEDAFDHALIEYEERAAARDVDVAQEIDPDLGNALAHDVDEYER